MTMADLPCDNCALIRKLQQKTYTVFSDLPYVRVVICPLSDICKFLDDETEETKEGDTDGEQV